MLNIPSNEWIQLKYSERRRIINKEKKRQNRINIAKQRQTEQHKFEEYLNSEEGIEEQILAENKRHKEEAERLLRHEEWLEREILAQEEFKQKKEKEEKKLKEREEREKMIREEWEEIEKREREEKEKKKKGDHSKEVLLEEALADIDQTLVTLGNKDHEEPWHNPFAPIDARSTSAHGGNYNRVIDDTILEESSNDPSKNYGTEKDKVNCPFYLKTGACRYGDRCSRHHAIPSISTTLMIRGMYVNAKLSRQYPDDQDAGLEVDENELFEEFEEFYKDVFPEFAECGKIIQFKVSRNFEPHLRGNVYVQFSKDEECSAAFKVFNGRWYAGKQLFCEYSPVQKWRTAICGLYNRQQCPKGKSCNFIHVFENPGGAFNIEHVDRIRDDSPPRRGRHHRRHYDSNRSPFSPYDHSSSRQDHRSERRNWRQRSHSPAPVSRRRSSSDLRSKRRGRSPHYSKRRRSSERSHSRSRSPRRKKKERSPSYSSDERSSKKSRRHHDDCNSDLSRDSSPSYYEERSSLSLPSEERKHKRKRKTKHGHHKKHKRRRHHSNSSNNDSDNDGAGGGEMKEIMDQVLRDISVVNKIDS